MREPTLREQLNRLRWSTERDTDAVALTVTTREVGVALQRRVAFAEIRDILSEGVLLADGTFLPYHRVVALRRDAETLWRARERRHDGGT